MAVPSPQLFHLKNSKLEGRGYTYVRTCHYLTNFNLFLILFSRFVCDLLYGWMESRWRPLDHCSICLTMIFDSWMNRYVCIILLNVCFKNMKSNINICLILQPVSDLDFSFLEDGSLAHTLGWMESRAKPLDHGSICTSTLFDA